MSTILRTLEEAAKAVRSMSDHQPRIGVVLGSGLGDWAGDLEDKTVIPYGKIPNMPVSAVDGHAGNLVLGVSSGISVACLQGRVHLYEGHSPERVVFGVRLLAKLGCHAILLTNAAGGLHFEPGTLMVINDHINFTGQNPLVGMNDDALGTRFPDMTRAYDARLRMLAKEAALEVGVPIEEGVYAAMLGPSYETPAEIALLRSLRVSAVGMSTVPEIIALRHMRVRAAAISCITNKAAGMTAAELDHAEVEATAKKSRKSFSQLLTRWIEKAGVIPPGPPSTQVPPA
jgi:purine-nucleoside phosphorylase